MAVPESQLALLRSVVGHGHPAPLLAEAWRRSGGDLAAAINIILDAPVEKKPELAAGGAAPILLDDDSGDEAPPPPRPAPPVPEPRPAARPPAAFSVPLGTAARASSSTAGTGGRKRARPQEQGQLETPPKHPAQPKVATVQADYNFHLGTIEVDGYSTIRVSPDEHYRGGEDDSMGPLLRESARLDLRWYVDAKRQPRGRAFSAESSIGKENGVVRFSACGVEVGKLPAVAARALVPLLARGMVSVEAFLGRLPPRELHLGTNVPVILPVSDGLRPTASAQGASGGRTSGTRS